ncbi:MAG: fumarylacetoacetase, partial [Saprospiraceae bacterium]
EPFKTKVQHREDQLNYLQSKDLYSYDINLKVKLNSEGITSTNFNNLYWTPSQQIAHHTINGCNLRVGDVLASGTVSGPEEKGKGCLLEITEGGSSPLELTDGTVRSNLIDGDKVELTGVCINGNIKVGFGENFGEIKKTKND